MMSRTLGIYWKLCWGIIVPWTLTLFFIYYMATFPELKYGDESYPSSAVLSGWILVLIAYIQVPIGMIYSLYKSEERTICAKIMNVCNPSGLWGPQDQNDKNEWLQLSEDKAGTQDDEYLLIKNTPNEECESEHNN